MPIAGRPLGGIVLLLLAAHAAACAPAPITSTLAHPTSRLVPAPSAPPDTVGIVAAGAGNIVAAGGMNAEGVPVKGQLLAPAGMVAAGAGNLVGTDGASYRLAAAALAGVVVQALDAEGRAIAGVAPARTGADGRFTLLGVPRGAAVVVTARLKARGGAPCDLEAVVHAGEAGEARVDAASTLVAAAVRREGALATLAADRLAAAEADARAAMAPEVEAAVAEGRVIEASLGQAPAKLRDVLARVAAAAAAATPAPRPVPAVTSTPAAPAASAAPAAAPTAAPTVRPTPRPAFPIEILEDEDDGHGGPGKGGGPDKADKGKGKDDEGSPGKGKGKGGGKG